MAITSLQFFREPVGWRPWGLRVGRKFFVALGTGRYCYLPPEEQLHEVPADVRSLTELFEGFGYRSVLPGLGEYDSAEQIRQKLRHWSADARLTPDDVLVLYFAGHGLVEDGDRHYLMCWDSHEEDPATTALATEDLVRILCRGDLRNLLLILDTCSAGAGGADAAGVALQALAYRHGGSGTSSGLWFLASARRKDIAEDGAFAAALRLAVQVTTDRTGQRQQYVDLTELVKAVNECFDADGRGQRAELAGGLVTGLAPFLPNAGFREELPPLGTDLEVQRRVAAQDLTEHFGPRSRGVEFESEQGLYFSGRVRVLTELVEWLTAADSDGRGRVITGSPGCGKSAVLGRIVALSNGLYRARFDLAGVDPATVVHKGCVTAAVHARHKRLEEVVERIATALGTEVDGTAALLQELTRRSRHGPPVVIVVDAVDEAGSDTAADAGGHGEPRRITRELLRPMAEIPGVRLLVGTRHELVTPLGTTFTCLDLDLPGYCADEEDVTGYVTKVLLATEEPEVRTPYRHLSVLARTVAEGVAARADGVYLYARTTARTLRSDRSVVDVSRQGWEEELPSEVGEAFDDYLARFGPDEPRVRRMLLPLAFSEGKGLPRGQVWTTLSSAISGALCTEQDASWLLDIAGAYVAEVIDDDGRSVYRLYHKALAEHLRTTTGRPAAEIQRTVVDALTGIVPVLADDGRSDWFAAPPYLQRHLATHAGAAGALVDLIRDPGFLLASEPLGLLRAFVSIDGDGPRQVRTAYEQVAHRMTPDRSLGSRASDLQLSARRCAANELADRIGTLGVELPWSARWAWWSASGAHRLLSGHTKGVLCVDMGDLDGRPIAVTGSLDKTARVWDLTTQRQIGEPLPVGIALSAIAIGDLEDYTVALTGGVDGTVRVWDLSAGQEYGRALTGHTNRIEAMRIGVIDGRPVLLTASQDGTARIWDLIARRQLGCEMAVHKRTVRDAALGELDGRPVAVTGGEDKAVYVWDLSDVLTGGDPRIDGSPLIGPAEAVTAVSLGRLDERTVALVGDKSGMLSLWDLAERRQLGEPVSAHRYFVRSGVASAMIGDFHGRAVALTAGVREAKLWDLRTLRQLGHPLRGHVDDIVAAALPDRGDASLAVTVGEDRTARIWDLSSDQPPDGHSGQVRSVSFEEIRGRPLALTGGEDGSARLWDLRTREEAGPPMTGHHGQVLAGAMGDVGGRLLAVTGGSDTDVRLWDPLRGEALGAPLTGHTNVVRCVAIGRLADEPLVVSGGEDGTVRVWSTRSGESLTPPLSGHIGAVRHLAVRSANGFLEIAIATSLDHAYVWRLSAGGTAHSGAPVAHFDIEDLTPTARAVGVAFHESRPVVLSTREGNGLYVHDIESRTPVGEPRLGHTGFISAASLVRAGAATLLASTAYDDTVRIWQLEEGTSLGEPLEGFTRLVGTEGPPAPALGRVDGTLVAITAYSREVRMWDLATSQPIGEPLCGVNHALVSVDVVPAPGGGEMVVTGSGDGTVRFHDLGDGTQSAAHVASAAQSVFDMSSAQWDGETVVVRGSWMEVEAWGLTPRRRLGKHAGSSWRTCLHSLEDGFVVVSASGDHTLHAWDLRTRSPVCPPMSGHTAEVMDLRPYRVGDSDLVASASADGTVRLWDLRTGEQFAEPIGGHGRGAFSVDFARLDRHMVVAGAGDGRVRFWDLADWSNAGIELEPFPSAVRALRVADISGTPMLIAADGYGITRVWDLRSAGWSAELDIGSGVVNLAVGGDRVCVATQMGAVVLGIHPVGLAKERSTTS
ncbi:caspase family protein [Streptomyces sp. Midd1]|uniref:caspase family protein n=1 Tax=Streptomyces sp. Midd3 TaxID=3161191 RepID=UPI0034DAF366